MANKHKTKEYVAWSNMKTRCNNPNFSGFERYGGRGIKIHKAWMRDFDMFLSDVGLAPTSLHSLDRIDNDGDYEPGNVKWSTRLEQNRNRTKKFKPQYKSLTGINGVTYRKDRSRWRVRISTDKLNVDRYFTTVDEAVAFKKKLAPGGR